MSSNEYNTLLVEEDTPLVQQPKTNNRVKLVLGAVGLGALGLMAGGAIGEHFASQSQNEEASSNDPDWVKTMSKKSQDYGSDSNAWCPSIDDAYCVYTVDLNSVSAQEETMMDALAKDDLVKAQDSPCDTGAYGYAYARCTEDCCNTYGDVAAFDNPVAQNALRSHCQSGCIQTLSDTCDSGLVQAADHEENDKFSFKIGNPSKSTFQHSGDAEVSAQYGGGFSCPEIICEEKKYVEENCEIFCSGGNNLFPYYLEQGAAILSFNEYIVGGRDGKKKKSTESPSFGVNVHRHRSYFDFGMAGIFDATRIDLESELQDGFSSNSGTVLDSKQETFTGMYSSFLFDVLGYRTLDRFFGVCVDACKSGCDYLEEYYKYDYGKSGYDYGN